MAGGRAPALRDFQQALALRPCARTEHFVLHHLKPAATAGSGELSTSDTPSSPAGVDEVRRFGQVLPKRHARRAVTRNLIRRQGRAVFVQQAPRLAPGGWLLRLRTPFDPAVFPSAASPALRQAVRAELDALFAAASA